MFVSATSLLVLCMYTFVLDLYYLLFNNPFLSVREAANSIGCISGSGWFVRMKITAYPILIITVNDLLNARSVYLIFVLKGGGGGGARPLLEGGVYFLSKVTHSNHYRNKLTALLNSNNFHTTFAEACKNKLVYMLFILGKTLSVMEKNNFWDLCNKRPPRGASIR